MRRHHRLQESLKQLSYDKPGIDNRAVKIRKSLDDVKKTLDSAWKKKDRQRE
ncbi:MAG: hypothetical protein KHY79_02280 [Clostridiales bacterium]|nr:hypothetical protein [Clostridiales bacterium]